MYSTHYFLTVTYSQTVLHKYVFHTLLPNCCIRIPHTASDTIPRSNHGCTLIPRTFLVPTITQYYPLPRSINIAVYSLFLTPIFPIYGQDPHVTSYYLMDLNIANYRLGPTHSKASLGST